VRTPQERAILTALRARGRCTEAELLDDLVKAKFPIRSTPAVIYRYYKHRTPTEKPVLLDRCANLGALRGQVATVYCSTWF
jgi:hypothetical protein